MLFKEGDIITGTKFNDYGVTDDKVVMKIKRTYKTSRSGELMEVMVIKTIKNNAKRFLKDQIGECFQVQNCSKKFKYFNSSIRRL